MAQKSVTDKPMTEEEIAAQKTRMFTLLGVGFTSLIASYGVGYLGPRTSVSKMTELMLTAIFLGCIFVAGKIALRLNKPTASK
jgi:hypothetical protein